VLILRGLRSSRCSLCCHLLKYQVNSLSLNIALIIDQSGLSAMRETLEAGI
jgi:hypothetical protein